IHKDKISLRTLEYFALPPEKLSTSGMVLNIVVGPLLIERHWSRQLLDLERSLTPPTPPNQSSIEEKTGSSREPMGKRLPITL
ncbi:hypothetical protein NPIL_225301, partial [Nephila pilipes]